MARGPQFLRALPVRLDDPYGIVYRAQSPAAAPGGEPPFATQTTSNQPLSGDDIQTLVKIPHYQDPQGTPEVLRVVMTTDDRESRLSDSGDSPLAPLPATPSGPPVPAGPPANPTPAAPPEAGPPAPFPGESAATPVPVQRTPMGLPMDELPFGPEPPVMKPVPLAPAAPDLDHTPGETAKGPIRDPALAPCPPQPNPFNVPQPIQPWQSNPRLPLMSYTRVFDGADGDLVAAARLRRVER